MIAGIAYLTFGAMPVLLALAANLLFPDEVDTAILSPAAVLAQNVFPRFVRDDTLRLNRIAVVLIAAASLAVAVAGEDAYSLLEEAYTLALVGLFVPLMIGLYSKPKSSRPAIASMLVGTGVWLLDLQLDWDYFLQPIAHLAGQLPISLAATACGLLAYFAVEPPWSIQWTRP